jgi:hypothetical protein
MPFFGKVSIRISRKKTDEQDERKAEKFLNHWVGNAAYRIQILAVNGVKLSLSLSGPFQPFQTFHRLAHPETEACSNRSKRSTAALRSRRLKPELVQSSRFKRSKKLPAEY